MFRKPRWVLAFGFALIFACCWKTSLSFPTSDRRPRKPKIANPVFQACTISKFRCRQRSQGYRRHQHWLTTIYKTKPQGSTDDSTGDGGVTTWLEQRQGFLVLLTVPFAWGTYEPAVRYVYALDIPVPGFVFSFSYYMVAAVALFCFALLPSSTGKEDLRSRIEWQQENNWPIREGIELGSYLFFGNALQLLGLETTASDRAAVLLQLNTIFVPILQAAFFAKDFSIISKRTWAACLVALTGVVFMGLDGDESVAFSDISSFSLRDLNLSFGVGDFLIITAAFVYSFHIIRLEKFVQNVSAIRLAATKATTEASWTALTIAFITSIYSSIVVNEKDPSNVLMNFLTKQGSSINSFFATVSSEVSSQVGSLEQILPAIYATLWTGLVTVGYTIYAQSIGQKSVDAVTANLIFAFQPVCTAIFAYILLGECLGVEGYVGAGLILGAVLLASPPSSKMHD